MAAKKHGERAHSKYSASGSERWMNCPGSVGLEEGLPNKDSKWSLEGTKAHELLENVLDAAISVGATRVYPPRVGKDVPREMVNHVTNAANFILGVWKNAPGSEILVETRVYLDFIDEEMFGTFDGAVIDHFGTLHIFDFKYGVSPVSPKKNLQMIFYGIGLAHKLRWNFENVRLWIIQPRVHGANGPVFWDVPIDELRDYVHEFRRGVNAVGLYPKKYNEGSWCHWCKAKKSICPLKGDKKVTKAKDAFANWKEEGDDGEEKEETQWSKKGPKQLKRDLNAVVEAVKEKGKGYPKGFWPEGFEDLENANEEDFSQDVYPEDLSQTDDFF